MCTRLNSKIPINKTESLKNLFIDCLEEFAVDFEKPRQLVGKVRIKIGNVMSRFLCKRKFFKYIPNLYNCSNII